MVCDPLGDRHLAQESPIIGSSMKRLRGSESGLLRVSCTWAGGSSAYLRLTAIRLHLAGPYASLQVEHLTLHCFVATCPQLQPHPHPHQPRIEHLGMREKAFVASGNSLFCPCDHLFSKPYARPTFAGAAPVAASDRLLTGKRATERPGAAPRPAPAAETALCQRGQGQVENFGEGCGRRTVF